MKQKNTSTKKVPATKEKPRATKRGASKAASPVKEARDNNPESPVSSKSAQPLKRVSRQIAAMTEASDL